MSCQLSQRQLTKGGLVLLEEEPKGREQPLFF